MKECPLCHTRYDDSHNFCVKDGQRLVTVEDNPPHKKEIPHEKKESQPVKEDKLLKNEKVPVSAGEKQKPKGGCAKKLLIGVAIAAVAAVAVFNYLKNATTYLRTEPEQVSVPKGGGYYYVDVDYDGYMWKVNYSPDWVVASKEDKSVYILVGSNTTGESREGSVTIQSGKHLAQIEINQNAYATYLRTGFSSLEFDKSGGIQGFEIETDGAGWTATYPDWMSVTNSDYQILTVECPENEGEYRTGMITLKEDYLQTTISVAQGGICDYCHGKGSVPCNVCMGMGGFGYGMYYSQCSFCGGTGSVSCGYCGGSGEREP